MDPWTGTLQIQPADNGHGGAAAGAPMQNMCWCIENIFQVIVINWVWVMVNGIAVGNHRLLHADIVTIGDHQLRVEVA